MKRFILSLCAMLCVLSGCAQKHGAALLDPKSPVTVTVWHYYNGIQQTQFDEMVRSFNETAGAEQGIIVEAKSKNSVGELADSVIAAVNNEPGADDPPDIFATYAETAYQLDRQSKLVDLSQYLTAEERAEYVGAYLDEGALGQEGALKIFPTAKSTEVFILNKTDWDKFAGAAGIGYDDLTTWESLAEIAAQYYDYTDALTPDIPNDGKAFFGRDAVANYMIVGAKQLGHPFAEAGADGSVTVSADKDTLRTLWDNFYVPFVKGHYAAESRFRSDDAKTGRITALIGSTSGATYYPTEVTVNDEYTYPIENEVLPVPGFAGCEPWVVQQGAGMSVLASDEKTDYACAVFLKWFTEADRNLTFSLGSGYLPVKTAANDYAAIEARSADLAISDTTLSTFRVATAEIASHKLYTSPPFDRSAAMRDYLEASMQSAAADCEAARARIAGGEDRETVWAEYTGDAAFEAWYTSFSAGLKEFQ